MKIAPVIDAIGFLGRVQKQDGENRRDSRGQNPQQNKKDDEEQNEQDADSSQRSFEESIASFNNDPQTQASGLSVSTAGSGPGLRVVLKDRQGAVVRQISGEEFVKLREEVAKSASGRGKILDRKL